MQAPWIFRFPRATRPCSQGLQRWRTGLTALACVAALCACGTPAQRLAVYDFGPGTTQPQPDSRLAPPLLLADVEASGALDGSAVWYRLGYADALQLRPYAQARWSMPPAQLLRQRLRELLGQRRNVLAPGDALQPATLVLRLELEEFSQLFDSSQSSVGLIRVRATLGRSGNPARTLAQTSFVLQHPAATVDASGGVKALALATDALAGQLDAWLQQVATEQIPSDH